MSVESDYLDLVSHIISLGVSKDDRTNTGINSIFGTSLRHDLNKGFPLLTTKKVKFECVLKELLWFLSGSKNANDISKDNCKIWDDWALEDGTVNAPYGPAWVDLDDTRIILHKDMFNFGPDWKSITSFTDGDVKKVVITRKINQIKNLVENIKVFPLSRRHVVTAWDPRYAPTERLSPQENIEIGNNSLPACHAMFQVLCTPLTETEKEWLNTTADYKLNLLWFQRSVDVMVGLPFNIASYALLAHMLAQVTGTVAGEVVFAGGDTHVYNNHLKGAIEQLEREAKELPRLSLNKDVKDIFDFTLEDFKLEGYDPEGFIKFEINV